MKSAVLLAGGAMAAVFVLSLAVLAGAGTGQDVSSVVVSMAQAAAQACPVSGSVPGLSAQQASNADAVVSAAMAFSAEDIPTARVAVTAALAASGLANVVGNNGAVGLYQELPSPSWGTAAQLLSPSSATGELVTHLFDIPGGEAIASWQAAQAAELPATVPTALVRADWARAGLVVDAVLRNANAPGSCGQGSGPLSGPTGRYGLPAGYVVPPGTSPEHAAAVTFALAQLGKPYVWGAAGPEVYDCSGLTMAAWSSAGVQLDHYTGDQQDEGVGVTPAALTPGDLVLVPGSDSPGPGIAGHVGIYLGDGLVESAIDPAMGVAVQSWATFVSGGLVALRDPAPGQ